MLAWKLDSVFAGLECLFNPGIVGVAGHVFDLAHQALGHHTKRRVLQDLLQLRLQIHGVLRDRKDKVAVKQNFEWRHKFVDHPVEVDVLVILLSSLYPHI